MTTAVMNQPPLTDRGVTKTRFTESWAGVDYYTGTTRNERSGMAWLDIWNKYKVDHLKRGNKVTTFKRHSYDCMTVGGLTWGYSGDVGYLMTGSSDDAHLTWQKVLPLANNVTRLDLQYTFEADRSFGEGGIGILQELYNSILKTEHPTKRHYHCHANSEGGETLYTGSRNSDQFGRMYNKSVEASLDKQNIFRLEVEFKKPRSQVVFNRFYHEVKMGLANPETVRDIVLSWFAIRGINVTDIFRTITPVQVSAVINTDEKKIKWLRTSVSPTLYDLTDRGKLREVAMALGLSSRTYRQLSLFAQDEGVPECEHAWVDKACIICGEVK